MSLNMTQNKMFPLRISDLTLNAFKSMECDSSLLWHERYGHLNFHGFHSLYKKDMVVGIPVVHHGDKMCEACIFGKHH